jgi:hypothetical protein
MKTEITKSVNLVITCLIITTIISHPGSLYVSSFLDTNNIFYSNITKNETDTSSGYIVSGKSDDKPLLTIESQIKEMDGNILKTQPPPLPFFTFNASDKKLPEILEYLKNNSDLIEVEKNKNYTTSIS